MMILETVLGTVTSIAFSPYQDDTFATTGTDLQIRLYVLHEVCLKNVSLLINLFNYCILTRSTWMEIRILGISLKLIDFSSRTSCNIPHF